jgi:hypothetical protein
MDTSKDLRNVNISDMNDSERLLVIRELTIQINETLSLNRSFHNYRFGVVESFLRDSWDSLSDFMKGEMTQNEVRNHLDLCMKGFPHFNWKCKKWGCDKL